MKQNITIEQFKELSDEGMEKLTRWACQKVDEETSGVPRISQLSIGQMIEFLPEQQDNGSKSVTNLMLSKGENSWYLGTMGNPFEKINGVYKECPELVDALWEAVKETLTS